MTIGILVDNISPSLAVRPDRFFSKASKPRVLVAKFGDGYEQRLADGINTIEQTFDVSFVNRSKTEIDDIMAYFDAKGGVTAFNFTIPDSNVGSPAETVIKVVCDTYNQVYVQTDCYTCTATFRRVYEA